MAYLTNPQSILSADDFTYAEMDVPEWGGTIRLKSISGLERTEIMKRMNRSKDTADGVFEKLVILGAVDETGRRIFTDDAATFAQMQAKDASVIQRIGTKVLEISGINKTAAADAEKN